MDIKRDLRILYYTGWPISPIFNFPLAPSLVSDPHRLLQSRSVCLAASKAALQSGGSSSRTSAGTFARPFGPTSEQSPSGPGMPSPDTTGDSNVVSVTIKLRLMTEGTASKIEADRPSVPFAKSPFAAWPFIECESPFVSIIRFEIVLFSAVWSCTCSNRAWVGCIILG